MRRGYRREVDDMWKKRTQFHSTISTAGRWCSRIRTCYRFPPAYREAHPDDLVEVEEPLADGRDVTALAFELAARHRFPMILSGVERTDVPMFHQCLLVPGARGAVSGDQRGRAA
jgi:hypothetical protein